MQINVPEESHIETAIKGAEQLQKKQSLTQHSRAAMDRKFGLESSYYFCKELMGYTELVPDVHGSLTTFLDDKRYSFKQVTMPRGFFKTSCVKGANLRRTIKALINGYDMNTLISSGNDDLTTAMLKDTIAQVTLNKRIQQAFPEVIPTLKRGESQNSSHAFDLRRPANSNRQVATFEAYSVGSKVVSKHYDAIIEDDIIIPDTSSFGGGSAYPSQQCINRATTWHKLAVSLCKHPKNFSIWNIGTRWHPNDLINYILTEERQSYASIMIPCYKPDGSPIWPARFDKAALDDIKQKSGSFMFSCLYLNNPLSEDQIVFNKDWIQYYDSPADLPEMEEIATVVDLAGFNPNQATYCDNVICTLGISKKDKHVYVIAYDAGKFSPTQVVTTVAQHYSRYNSQQIYVESVAYQWSITDHSRRESEIGNVPWLPWVATKVDNRANAKHLRILGIQPVLEFGALHIRKGMTELVKQIEDYCGPSNSKVDIIDCLGHYINEKRFMVNDLKNVKKETILVDEGLSFDELQRLLKQGRSNNIFENQLKSLNKVSFI